MSNVSEIRWKPSYGLRIIAVWSWRYIHFDALSVFGFQLVNRRIHERSWYIVRALVKPSGDLCIPVSSIRALVYKGTSPRKTHWRLCISVYGVRALVWEGTSARDQVCYLCNLQYALASARVYGPSARKSLVQTFCDAYERSLVTYERS